MASRTGLALLAASLATAAVAAAGAARASDPAHACHARSTRVVVETPVVRVDFVLRHGLRRYSYCLLATGQRRFLVADTVFDSVADIRVTRRYVGWINVSCDSAGVPCVRNAITVRALRQSKIATTLGVEGPVTEWVLAADGAAAWAGRSGAPDARGQGYVAMWNRRTTTRLARSADVDPDSLALANSGRRIFWTKAGHAESQAL